MKIILVTGLLAAMLITLIIGIDVIMGVRLSGVFWKATNPFRVMEPAEYIILILFILFFFIDSIGSYLNKKRQNNPPSNS
ncbi:hypothetical protein V7161_28270 [Neobacillus drentensis]|uniref:hypothetical protein n=1 Tax=Neobacillus drentensis TaxID=220684 RepID=UPI003001B127